MIRLELPKEPYDIAILDGVSFTIQPLTSRIMSVCQAKARNLLDQLVQGIECVETAGLLDEPDIDVRDPVIREGLYQVFLVKEIGAKIITAWSGVKIGDTDDDAPVDEKNVRAVLDDAIIADIFYQKACQPYFRIAQAKKDSAVAVNGISKPAAAANTAKSAKKKGHPAA